MRRLSRDGGCPFERKLLGKGKLDDDGEAVHERTTQSKQHRAAVRQRKPLDIEPILLARQLQEGTEKRAVGQVAAERALLLEGKMLAFADEPPAIIRQTHPSKQMPAWPRAKFVHHPLHARHVSRRRFWLLPDPAMGAADPKKAVMHGEGFDVGLR
jgi:hypothetical protein